MKSLGLVSVGRVELWRIQANCERKIGEGVEDPLRTRRKAEAYAISD